MKNEEYKAKILPTIVDRIFALANNPDFDTVTPSQKSGVSLMPKWGQVDRTWGQIVDYVNPVGPKEIPQALVLRASYFLLA
jgi:hypothetical protein